MPKYWTTVWNLIPHTHKSCTSSISMVFSTALQKLTVCGYYCLNLNIILLQKKQNTVDVKKTSMLEIGTDVVSKVHSTRCLIWKLQLFSTITITIYTHHFLLGILIGKNTCLWKKNQFMLNTGFFGRIFLIYLLV